MAGRKRGRRTGEVLPIHPRPPGTLSEENREGVDQIRFDGCTLPLPFWVTLRDGRVRDEDDLQVLRQVLHQFLDTPSCPVRIRDESGRGGDCSSKSDTHGRRVLGPGVRALTSSRATTRRADTSVHGPPVPSSTGAPGPGPLGERDTPVSGSHGPIPNTEVGVVCDPGGPRVQSQGVSPVQEWRRQSPPGLLSPVVRFPPPEGSLGEPVPEGVDTDLASVN